MNALKSHIQTYGPLATAVYAGSEFNGYDGTTTIYRSGTPTPNHQVLIIGWDDNLVHAGGKGAWIYRNSWGTDWGGPCGYGAEGGYFAIAYGSSSIGMWSSFVADWQEYNSTGGLMYYDEAGGWRSAYGLDNGTTTAWGLAKFRPAKNTYVTGVEFWTVDATTDVDVYV